MTHSLQGRCSTTELHSIPPVTVSSPKRNWVDSHIACFSDRPSVIWIRINHFPWDKFSRIIDRLHANSVILTELKRNFQSRTGKLVSIDICPIADRFHITRKPRVSNMFIVLCFPLGCFMPCQPHGVVSDLDIHVIVDNDENLLYIS